MNQIAAAGYLVGLVVVTFLVIFSVPALLWIVAAAAQ